jgi:transketolase
LIDYFMSSVPCAADRRSSPPPQHKNDLNLDGSAAHGGTLPFCVTFLIFSNCMRLPIRLAAMMGLHVINVFTRDSITLGQDGSTHQPVEHLTGLRESPSLTVIRRGDADETAVAWRVALQVGDHPVASVLRRQNRPRLDRTHLPWRTDCARVHMS